MIHYAHVLIDASEVAWEWMGFRDKAYESMIDDEYRYVMKVLKEELGDAIEFRAPGELTKMYFNDGNIRYFIVDETIY